MNRFKQIKITVLIGMVVALFAWGCGTGSDAGTGTMQVKMHDNPGDYDEVNISVERVEVNRSEGDEGWQTISEPNETYNILELINGEFEVLADAELETGIYQQIRLILSDNNTVVVDGETFNMTVPSGAETGLKLNINAEITEGIVYVLLLDFDADRSVRALGAADGYNLVPVVRATAEAITGNISGTISPAEARAMITAEAGDEIVSTTYADEETGEFTLVGLEDDSYTITVEPREDGYESEERDNVEVMIGEVTNLGEIVLSESAEE